MTPQARHDAAEHVPLRPAPGAWPADPPDTTSLTLLRNVPTVQSRQSADRSGHELAPGARPADPPDTTSLTLLRNVPTARSRQGADRSGHELAPGGSQRNADHAPGGVHHRGPLAA
jgi:hypothetical protein